MRESSSVEAGCNFAFYHVAAASAICARILGSGCIISFDCGCSYLLTVASLFCFLI